MEFTEQTLHFEADYDGEVVATLISLKTKVQGRAVLYVHGYTDYFFQEHVAKWFVGRGVNFYAVDLRKYGRSLREGQHPNFCMSLEEYYDDITASLHIVAEDGNHDITLMGHSTGGLITALYADNGSARDLISRLVLNSPFFEFNTTSVKNNVIIPVATLLSRIFPFLHSKPELSPHYARSVHRDYYGEWSFDTTWKPIEGFPLYFSWLAAVRKGQSRVRRGLNIGVPVLVLCSARSHMSEEWDDRYMTSDGVLNVEHIARDAVKLGPNVVLVRIESGMHDLFLSSDGVRGKVFDAIAAFMTTDR